VPGTKSTKAKPSKKAPPPEFQCGFCSKAFVTEKSLISHMCVQKGRELDRDQKTVRMGLSIYVKFYEKNCRGAKQRTWTDFVKSRHYNDFVKVGTYITDIAAVNAPLFIDFLVTSSIPIAQWRSPKVYQAYLTDLLRNETPDAAIERNIVLMQQWAADTDHAWTDFFKIVSPAQATAWIQTGRISPWLIYISGASDQMTSRFTPEQWAIIEPYLDPGFWEVKMSRYKDEVEYFKKTLAEFGL
jgi:hypothetical protein